jgi:hypothetical protein
MSESAAKQLQLAPLGAGDLIDRAVRLYRRHLFILIRTAAPPTIIAAFGGIVFRIGWSRIWLSSDSSELILYLGLMFLGVVTLFGGYLFTLVVMGGATRNLVAHLLHNDPVSAQAAYAAVKARFWGLVGASLLVLLWIGCSSIAAFLAFYMIFAIIFGVAVLFSLVLPAWIGITLAALAGLAALTGLMVVFFFIVGRVAYVPQVMLVEGKSVFDAFSRSFTLARGNVRRLMAMTLFTSFATYSALMVLLLPLGFVAFLAGVNPLSTGGQSPMWYQISYGVLATSSSIVLTPVWMLGLSLLYVDERVRHEGYDIELMAAQQLGEYPDQRGRLTLRHCPLRDYAESAASASDEFRTSTQFRLTQDDEASF